MIRHVRTKRQLPPYTYLGCPLTMNRTAKCFGICSPDSQGKGTCGRLAPHSMRGRHQKAIDAYKENCANCANCAGTEQLA